MTDTRLGARNTSSWLWREGGIGGIVAAVIYTVFVEIVNVATNRLEAFFVPFRQIGAILLGAEALDRAYDVVTATLVGSVIHFTLAAVFGVVVALVGSAIKARSTVALIILGTALGLGLYAINVFVVFPAVFPWFLANDRITQSIGHALFGGLTGYWLAWRNAQGQV